MRDLLKKSICSSIDMHIGESRSSDLFSLLADSNISSSIDRKGCQGLIGKNPPLLPPIVCNRKLRTRRLGHFYCANPALVSIVVVGIRPPEPVVLVGIKPPARVVDGYLQWNERRRADLLENTKIDFTTEVRMETARRERKMERYVIDVIIGMEILIPNLPL
ncbi:hypothetical protein L2E82_42890 [Cichorium intybus]|uniref:Uncharacterized protein n=1 Tax=Cichorium intybus TaxID=13427 RepID=A0ACB8ZN25_CICIN|nr:hypothetical protein L2E82_42890 [Cichorium intybus]